MPRPRKCRRVCCLPEHREFVPCGKQKAEAVIMTVDEYETIRLIDKEGFSQEECSRYMNVARTTIQLIYNNARRKLACALVDGLGLKIEGGDYTLCDGSEQICFCGGCRRHREMNKIITESGGTDMKIAVTYESGQVFQHFGHTSQFKLYEVEDGRIKGSEVVDTGDSGHGALAGFLQGKGVSTLICGGIGGGARNALAEAGIELYGGVSGSADEAVAALLAGKLAYDPNVQCNHHDHGEGHSCGGHGHGEGHSCGDHGHC